MAVSMRDVARVAGVSQRTVSNVVNDYPHVKADTRQRVQDAIRELHYRPNISAQKLRNGRTGIVALAMPEIAAPYFAELADHLQRYAASRGITLLIDQTGGTRDRELLVLDGYRSNIIDGLIFSPISVSAEDVANSPLDVPVVLLGESIEDSIFLHVSVDNEAAARTATDHLLSRGRRRIAAVGAHPPGIITGPAQQRTQGYSMALASAGLERLPSRIYRTQEWTRSRGYQTAADIATSARDVDALFCFNDSLALGALKGFAAHGVRVPDDIAVVGWDDIEEAAYSTPTLTSIAPDKQEIATRAVDGLLDGTGPVDGTEVTCSYVLRERESSGSIPDPGLRGRLLQPPEPAPPPDVHPCFGH